MNNNNTVEYLLLNLKIIAKIPQNGRIQRAPQGGLICIESGYFNNFFLGIKRFYYGDSRSLAINDIQFIVNLAIDTIRKVESRVTVGNLVTELKCCIQGLNNLKLTYTTDITTVSKLDIIIQNIGDFLIGIVPKEELDTLMYNRINLEEV